MSDQSLIPTFAEDVVMGQILIDHRVITTAARLLKPEQFGSIPHRTVYETCLKLWREGSGVDLLTVTTELQRTGTLDAVGGPAGIAGWTMRVASPRHFEEHAAIVRDHYGMRVLHDAGAQMILGALPGEDPTELLPPMNAAIQEAAGTNDAESVRAGDVAYAMQSAGERPKPIYLGCEGLDGLVFVLPDNIVTIKAEAGGGKTAMALSIILNLLPQVKTWFVSLEMSATELTMRALCQLAEVDLDAAMSDRMNPGERDRMALAAATHADILNNMIVEECGSMDIDTFMARAEHMVKSMGAGLIVVDYAQLMEADPKEHPTQAQQLEAISKGFHKTARKLKVPMVVIVHINKEGGDHGTGQFEKDAHIRLKLSYKRGDPTMEVDVTKNRNGRCQMIHTPCVMRHGIVGRNGPPYWAAGASSPVLPAPRPSAPHPDNFIEPTF